jgi:hypothetical protein
VLVCDPTSSLWHNPHKQCSTMPLREPASHTAAVCILLACTAPATIC